MAVTGVSNLAELISNQSLENGQNAAAAAPPAPAQNASPAAAAGDTFTPSAQGTSTQTTAQDAGIFQVSQYALSAATANVLSAQAAPPAPNEAPAQTVTIAPAPTQTEAAQTSGAHADAPVPTPAPDAAPAAAAVPQTTANPTASSAANSEQEVQALNTVLLSLGFSSVDIQNIDRIATVTNDFNPPLYSDLVQQFAGQAGEQTSATANVPAAPTTNSTV